jgi:hypothetical protein
MRGAATGPAVPAPSPAPVARPAAPQPSERFGPGKAWQTKFTLLLSERDADALDQVAATLRRQLGRRRLDRSEVLRGLIRLTSRDLSLMAQLAEELSGPE